MVEITAINHKLLFEITALISPRPRKEKEKGPEGCARQGGTGMGWIPLGLVGDGGVPKRATQNSRRVLSSGIVGGSVREGFFMLHLLCLCKFWVSSWAGWGSVGV